MYNNFKIIHLNIQYLREKIDLFNIFLQTEQPHIVVVSEHGLKKEELYCINFHGYHVVGDFSRVDHKSSGGIAILSQLNLSVDIVNMNSFSKEMIFESAGVEIVVEKKFKFILFGIYRPPLYTNVNIFFNVLYDLLSKYLYKGKYCMIVGDLNIDWLKRNTTTYRLNDLMNEFDLKQFVNSPTRVTSSTATLIDHALSNIERDVIHVEVIGTGLSDHFAQKITLSFKNPTTQKINTHIPYNTFYDTCSTNVNTLNFLLAKESWTSLKALSCSEQKLRNFIDVFNYNFSLACPLKRKKKVKANTVKPWLTKGIIISSNKLKQLDLQRKINQSREFHNYYITYKKIYRKIISVAKAYHLNKQLASTDNIARDAWRIIDSDRSNKQVSIPADMPSPETFNHYFANIGKQKQSLITEPVVRTHSDISCPYTLGLLPTDPQEIYKIIMRLKNSNSSGYDGLNHKIIRQCAINLCEPLADIINSSLSEGLFPNELKQTILCPIFKSGDSNLPENWRPIANLSTISKIFEHVFAQRLLDFLFQNNLLCKEQFGFTKGKCTTDAMVALVTKAVNALDHKNKSVGVFLDFQKAFDCLDHDILFNRLYNLGVRGLSLDWIKSYLQNRTQRVKNKCNNILSGPIEVNLGIPQGSVLGPILYILYTNSITKTFTNLNISMYADDVSLIFENRTLNDLEIDSFLKLTNLFQYFNNNNLHVNANKSNCINFSKSNQSDQNVNILMNDFEITCESEAKYLGLIIDDSLSWTPHINALCTKVSSQLFLLTRFSKYQNCFLMQLIYTSLIESRLRYGIIVWGSTSRSNFLRVFRLQKRAIRIIVGTRRGAHCRNFFKTLGILTLPSLYILEVLMFYRFKSETILTGTDAHNYNTRYREEHRQFPHRLQIAAKLPHNIGPKLFNKLPPAIKTENIRTKFKTKLCKHLLERACYSVTEYLT